MQYSNYSSFAQLQACGRMMSSQQ